MARADELKATLAALGIDDNLIASRSLALCPEAQELELAEIGENGREHLLTPAAAAAWREMSAAARTDGVVIRIASAFRSIDRQTEIVRNKLAQGATLAEVLSASAPPGFSEHHSGCAIDIGTPECTPFEAEFERTPAFRWLIENASRFGFVLSFPRGNPQGYQYEPWHWRYRA